MILPKESATFSSCRFKFFRANKNCFLSRTRVDSMSMYDNVKSDIAENCDEDYPTPRISWALFALFISHVAHYAPSSQDKNHLKLWAWPLTDIVETALRPPPSGGLNYIMLERAGSFRRFAARKWKIFGVKRKFYLPLQ